MTGSEVRKQVLLSPIALAVAIGVAAQTLLPLPWSPMESAQAHQNQCSLPGGGGGAADSGAASFDGGCCDCDGSGAGSGDGGGGGCGGGGGK